MTSLDYNRQKLMLSLPLSLSLSLMHERYLVGAADRPTGRPTAYRRGKRNIFFWVGWLVDGICVGAWSPCFRTQCVTHMWLRLCFVVVIIVSKQLSVIHFVYACVSDDTMFVSILAATLRIAVIAFMTEFVLCCIALSYVYKRLFFLHRVTGTHSSIYLFCRIICLLFSSVNE